jgi:hypothetical protein
MQEMMKFITVLALALVFAGCASRPSVTEARLRPFYEPSDGALTEVQGKVLTVRNYSDMAERTDSLATYPHLHLEVELTRGHIPRFPKAKVFDCHLALEPDREYAPGDTILLLFDDQGNLETVGRILKGPMPRGIQQEPAPVL